jgi:hypothetical protein
MHFVSTLGGLESHKLPSHHLLKEKGPSVDGPFCSMLPLYAQRATDAEH